MTGSIEYFVKTVGTGLPEKPIGLKVRPLTTGVMMARRSKPKLAKSATYARSLGAALDEIGFKPLGRRIKVKSGVGNSSRGLKAKAEHGRQQD